MNKRNYQSNTRPGLTLQFPDSNHKMLEPRHRERKESNASEKSDNFTKTSSEQEFDWN